MSFFTVLFPIFFMFSFFTGTCLVLAIISFITNFRGTRKFNIIDTVATIGTFIFFFIFATFTYKGFLEFTNSEKPKCNNYSCEIENQ